MAVEFFGSNTGDTGNTEDSYLDMANPTDNPDTSAQIRISWFSSTLRYMSGIRFTGLSTVPTSNVVSSASLFVMPHNDGSAITYAVRRMLRPWVVDEITWDIAYTGQSWTTAGGLSDGNDRTGAPEGTDTLTDGVQQYEEMTGLATIAQNWVDETWDNDGLHLQSTAVAFGDPFRHIISSDGVDGDRPYLSVDHAAAGVTYALKYTNGSTGVLANMRATNGSTGAEVVLKTTNGSTGIIINTSGV